jgi:imidazolonepropionase-like amidohydrolase
MQSMWTLPRGRAALVAVALVLAGPAGAAAQYQSVPRPAAYALENVTVVRADGRAETGVNLVVRGSLIEAMGRDVAIPADAERLEGDSLWVYPGIVDGAGDVPHAFPQPEIDRSEVEIWNAPRSLRGFMPARRVSAHITATGEDLADQRKAGIVAGAVHPDGGMMAGRGALLVYRPDAGTPAELVVEPALGPTFTFRGGRGVYPATLFGVMASIRQAFEDAEHRRLVAEAYDDDPRRMTTPAHDPDYAVLQEVLDGDAPVYFAADRAADILRVLGLSDEYGFRPVIVGGAEAWKVADELERRSVPVLVSTDFPEPRRWDPEADEAELLDAAAAREKMDTEDRYANAGRLADAGVTFALTSGGKGKILEGARKAVEHGLAPDAALAALTRTPAALFGIEELTRLEAGRPATFIVTTGALFEKETTVAYTLVEGHKEDGSKAEPGAGSAEEAVDVGGVWTMDIDASGQAMSGVLTIEQDGATFTGSLMLEGQKLPLRGGVIDGNQIRVIAVMEQGGETLDVKITGTVEGDEASGEADVGPLGVARWEAKRTGPGGAR